jgi:tryptophan 2,3-dioxygenase
MESENIYYKDYLHLKEILSSQQPRSFLPGHEPAHDEMLFIIIHQAFELWFKQILFELEYVCSVFGQQQINDNSEEMNLVYHRLQRVEKIMELLNQQVGILDTMTPLDFLAFRNLLTPASGFQSVQFRLIEAKLGLQMEKRHHADYYKRTNTGGFNPEDFESIHKVESDRSLLQMVNDWLERLPFFEAEYWMNYKPSFPGSTLHPFWNDYKNIYTEGLNSYEKGKLPEFEFLFFEIVPVDATTEETDQLKTLRHQLSPAAMRAALFIMLYRDFPVFQNSFRILDTLVDIDNRLAGWRHAHYRMVRRMIGMRVGTGNTSGAGYLEGAASKHYIFRDIAGLSTYLIERKKLPKLPDELIRKLGFANTGGR